MKKIILLILLIPTFLVSQTHVIPEGYTGFFASFKHDKNVDFFGEGKFLKDSFANELGIGYIYNGMFSIDFGYGYSFYNRKETYTFSENTEDLLSDNENFNFVENFRVENSNVDDKGFSLGMTYYLTENQDFINQNLPVNISFGFRYGSSAYKSNALKFLNQDFYGKYYSFEFGLYKELETSASFFVIPRIKFNITNEKNIHNVIVVSENQDGKNSTDSFNSKINYFEIAIPFILSETSSIQPFFEPSIANKHGSTHFGLRFGMLF